MPYYLAGKSYTPFYLARSSQSDGPARRTRTPNSQLTPMLSRLANVFGKGSKPGGSHRTEEGDATDSATVIAPATAQQPRGEAHAQAAPPGRTPSIYAAARQRQQQSLSQSPPAGLPAPFHDFVFVETPTRHSGNDELPAGSGESEMVPTELPSSSSTSSPPPPAARPPAPPPHQAPTSAPSGAPPTAAARKVGHQRRKRGLGTGLLSRGQLFLGGFPFGAKWSALESKPKTNPAEGAAPCRCAWRRG